MSAAVVPGGLSGYLFQLQGLVDMATGNGGQGDYANISTRRWGYEAFDKWESLLMSVAFERTAVAAITESGSLHRL